MFKKCLSKMSAWAWWQISLIVILISVMIEAIACNPFYWTQFISDYQKIYVLDSQHRYLAFDNDISEAIQNVQDDSERWSEITKQLQNQGPIILSKDRSSLSFFVDDVKIRNVRIDVYHPNNPNLLIKGTISAQTVEQKYISRHFASFVLATKFDEANNILLPERPISKKLTIKFDIPEQVNILISAIIINDDISMNFVFVRWLCWLLLLGLPLFAWRYRLYTQICNLDNPAHRYLNLSVVFFNLLLVVSVLYINNTITGENSKSRCIFPQQCSFDYGSDQGSLLQDPPKNYEELYNSNIYTQQFDAWLKGQTYLDLKVDPRISEMEDIYDISEFYHLNVGFLFDHVIYKQRYYCYYGVSALVMVYAPIYALTGKYPTLILTLSLLAALAVVMLHLSVSALYRTFAIRANLLLFLLGQMAVPAAAMVYVTQVASYPYMSAIATGAAVIGLGYSAWLAKGYKRCILAFFAGLFVVLVVMSRPHELLVLIWFFIPLLWLVYKRWLLEKEQYTLNSQKDPSVKVHLFAQFKLLLRILDLKAILCCAIVVTLGALGIMYYNYVRFDSIFNFGQSLMITASENVTKVRAVFDISNIWNAIYHILWDNASTNTTFPYIQIEPNTPDTKSYHSFPKQTFGLLAFGINWVLFLLFLGRKSINTASVNDLDEQSMKVLTNTHPSSLNAPWYYHNLRAALPCTLIVVTVLSITLGVVNIIWADNLLPIYALECAWCVSLVSVILIFENIHWDHSRSSRMLYMLVVYALFSTLIFGYCYNFLGDIALRENKDINLQIINFMRPFLVTE